MGRLFDIGGPLTKDSMMNARPVKLVRAALLAATKAFAVLTVATDASAQLDITVKPHLRFVLDTSSSMCEAFIRRAIAVVIQSRRRDVPRSAFTAHSPTANSYCVTYRSRDDCNGMIDDGTLSTHTRIGMVGGSGVGDCRPGTQRCVAGAPACIGATGPTPEVCDGRANNCNGMPGVRWPRQRLRRNHRQWHCVGL